MLLRAFRNYPGGALKSASMRRDKVLFSFGGSVLAMATKLPYLSDDHHFAIANVAAQSAQLDSILDSVVYFTIAPREVSLYLVKNLGPDRLVEILRLALVAELSEYAPKINALFEHVKTMRGARNHVLHWLHEATDSKEIVRFTDKRRGRERKPKDFTASDIQKIAEGVASQSVTSGTSGWDKIRSLPTVPPNKAASAGAPDGCWCRRDACSRSARRRQARAADRRRPPHRPPFSLM